ncbi:MAG: hypothetical protein ACYC27_19935 [Armatimonadota bacterium]
MARIHTVRRIPQWIWVFLAISGLLLLLIVLSMASVSRKQMVIVAGPEVETGNPADYIRGRQPVVIPTVPAVPPSEGVVPAPDSGTPEPPPNSSAETPPPPPPPDMNGGNGSQTDIGMPESFTFQGKQWQLADGPLKVDVVTTGEITGDYIIYRKQNDSSPYDALYLETQPNSGEFYRYTSSRRR